MSISGTYKRIIVDDYLKAQLLAGNTPSALDIIAKANTLVEDLDLTVPQFTASEHYTKDLEQSSVSKFKETTNSLRQDMRALYKEMINLTSNSTEAFERWKLEAVLLEKGLIDLENRIENLLLLTQDTEGYHSVLIDNFTDNSLTDIDLTNADMDYLGSRVTLNPNNNNTLRIFLNNIQENNINFRVRNQQGLIGRSDGIGTRLRDLFLQESRSWWTTIHMRTDKIRPVTCELSVKLSEEAIDISKIHMELHDSAQSGPLFVTPLHSLDNVNFFQLPTKTFSQEVRGSTTFSFEQVKAKYIKFVLTKIGPDPGTGKDTLDFQIGFKEISFHNEGFTEDTIQQFFSKALWIANQDGTPFEFEKLVLETCETIEENTTIDYFIATSNTANFAVDDNTLWVPISPLQRAIPEHPVIINVSDTAEQIFGDTEDVKISYSSLAEAAEKNPAAIFQLLSRDGTDGDIQDETISGISPRYRFVNSNDRILNYQIKDADFSGSGSNKILTDENTFVVFRNVGTIGSIPGDVSTQVRSIQRGWKFKDPYYSTVVEILNPLGLKINVGDQPIIIDDNLPITNIVTIPGKTTTSDGVHLIQVHKDNWREVLPSASSLTELKRLDPLYTDQGAYNHKLLIEGYEYNTSWPTTETKPYIGVDLFASEKMKQVSVFDLNNNIAIDKYDIYALDRDASNTHTVSGIGENSPTRVFVVKVNESNPDFQNEKFMIRFKLLNELRKYLRIRADLLTTNGKITPSLDSYKVKLG